MAKSKASSKNGNMSEAIREIFQKRPSASLQEVQTVLAERGIKASNALVNKIKYGRGKNGSAKKSAKRRKGRSSVNKAEAIRGAWSELGVTARPRDVIALLKSRGIKVASAQVSTLRKSAGKKHSAVVASLEVVPFAHLVAAKSLVARLGGIEQAQHALASLSKLLNS
ncbi:MAG: hypothetical protein AB7O59_02895 [Pirellulales bacterium]